MTEAQVEARLTKVRAAIDWILDGNVQSRAIAGRSLTVLSLTELRAMEKDLEAELARVQAGGLRGAVIRFVEPS